jgi:hypothetical protein
MSKQPPQSKQAAPAPATQSASSQKTAAMVSNERWVLLTEDAPQKDQKKEEVPVALAPKVSLRVKEALRAAKMGGKKGMVVAIPAAIVGLATDAGATYAGLNLFHNDVQSETEFTEFNNWFDEFRLVGATMSIVSPVGLAFATVAVVSDIDEVGTSGSVNNIVALNNCPLRSKGNEHGLTLHGVSSNLPPPTRHEVFKKIVGVIGVSSGGTIADALPGSWCNTNGGNRVTGAWRIGAYPYGPTTWAASTTYAWVRREYLVEFRVRRAV